MQRSFPRRLWLALAAFVAASVMVAACGESDDGEDSQVHEPVEAPAPALAHITMDGQPVYIPPGPERQSDVPENLTEAIKDGVALMESVRMDKSKCGGRVRPGWKRCLGDYLIAASDADGNITVVEAYEDRASTPANFSVRCERNDGSCDVGVNVPIIVEAPPGWTVVAVRTAVWDKKGPDGISGAVYVPYTSRLNTPELRLAGLRYLTQAVEVAHTELEQLQVPSQYIKGSLATDFGTPDHVVTLTLTEQMRSDVHFVEGDAEARIQMLNRSLVILGANQAGTSRYSRSRVGAAGIVQLMPRTYKALDKQYPLADLPDDVVEGRVNHNSAFKAAIVHTDSEWWPMRGEDERFHREFLLGDPWQRRLVFAGGYNANIKTVDRAIHKCGDDWRQESCTTLPGETRRYLIKYEWIYQVLFDEVFRTEVEREMSADIVATAEAG